MIPDSAPQDVAVSASSSPRGGARSGREDGRSAHEAARRCSRRGCSSWSRWPRAPRTSPRSRPTWPTPTRRCAAPRSPRVTEVVPEGAGPALAAVLLDDDARSCARRRGGAARAGRGAAGRRRDARRAAGGARRARPGLAGRGARRAAGAAAGRRPRLFRAAPAATATPRVRLQAVRGLVSLDDVAGVLPPARTPRARSGWRPPTASGRSAHAAGASTWSGSPATPSRWCGPRRSRPRPGCPASRSCGGWPSPAQRRRSGRSGSAPSAAWRRPGRTSPYRPWPRAVDDTHADVRKAAVITLADWAGRPEVADALERATKDIDADVRGYARRALSEARREARGQPPLIRVFAWS